MRSTIKSAKTVEEAIELGIEDLGLSRSEIDYEILEEAKSGFLGIFGARDAIVRIFEKEDFKIDINDIYGTKAKKEKELEEKRQAEQEARDKEESQKRLEAARKADAEMKAEAERRKLEEEKERQIVQENKNSKSEFNKEEALEDDDEDREDYQAKPEGLTFEENLEAVKGHLAYILDLMHIKANIEADLDENSLNYNLIDISEEDTGIVIGRKGETLDSLQYILSLMANRNSSEFTRVSLNVANYRDRRKEAIENNARKVAFKVIKSKKSIALSPMNSYERRIVHYALQKYKEVETVSQGSFPNRKVIIKYKN